MIDKINAALAGLMPFVLMVAMVFGVIAAWHGLAELFPFIRQVWAPRGSMQSMGTVGACLALIAIGANGGMRR